MGMISQHIWTILGTVVPIVASIFGLAWKVSSWQTTVENNQTHLTKKQHELSKTQNDIEKTIRELHREVGNIKQLKQQLNEVQDNQEKLVEAMRAIANKLDLDVDIPEEI